MCGINLIIDKNTGLQDDVIQRMNTAIHHRGPDASGWIIKRTESHSIHLGNTRLQIVDPDKRSNQPMGSQDELYWLTFNGEIYNYKELRVALEKKGYEFKTESDTEVALYWLVEYGKAGLSALNGMFALVFLDLISDSILVARDRHGIKPLYYSRYSKRAFFSSEIKGIQATNLTSNQLNENQIQHYLQFRYAKAPETFHKGIFSVKPGHCISIQNDEWTEEGFVKHKQIETETLTIDQVESHLLNSVERSLKADTQVGLFLSGGIDSTLLLALSKELGVQNLPTFSISHSLKEGSYGTEDGKFAKLASEVYDSEHYEFQINSGILDSMEEHLGHMDQPIGDSSSLLSDYLSKETARNVKSVLSGAGADEWFAGYNRHEAYYRYLSNGIIKGNSKILRGVANWLPTGIDHPLRKPFQLAKKFLNNLDSDPQETYMNFLSFPYFREVRQRIETIESDLFQWALNHDRSNYLVEDVLSLSDQWTMRNSIEMRVPYLDNELTKLISSVDQKELITKGKKWILKDLLTKYGGQKFVDRPKEGFGLPTGKWLQDGMFREQLNFLNDPKSIIFKYIEKDRIANLVHAHERKKGDYSLEFWNVMTLANWLQVHFA